jgi:hypothetical protein
VQKSEDGKLTRNRNRLIAPLVKRDSTCSIVPKIHMEAFMERRQAESSMLMSG